MSQKLVKYLSVAFRQYSRTRVPDLFQHLSNAIAWLSDHSPGKLFRLAVSITTNSLHLSGGECPHPASTLTGTKPLIHYRNAWWGWGHRRFGVGASIALICYAFIGIGAMQIRGYESKEIWLHDEVLFSTKLVNLRISPIFSSCLSMEQLQSMLMNLQKPQMVNVSSSAEMRNHYTHCNEPPVVWITWPCHVIQYTKFICI